MRSCPLPESDPPGGSAAQVATKDAAQRGLAGRREPGMNNYTRGFADGDAPHHLRAQVKRHT